MDIITVIVHSSFETELKDTKFICEKKLLTSGTMEDFEKLFDGKIIRKLTKQM